MASHACPVCGDPRAFPIWLDARPPRTCPDDPAWPERSLTSICARQRRRAERDAAMRKLTPDAFDADGVVIPGQFGRAFSAWVAVNPGATLI